MVLMNKVKFERFANKEVQLLGTRILLAIIFSACILTDDEQLNGQQLFVMSVCLMVIRCQKNCLAIKFLLHFKH